MTLKPIYEHTTTQTRLHNRIQDGCLTQRCPNKNDRAQEPNWRKTGHQAHNENDKIQGLNMTRKSHQAHNKNDKAQGPTMIQGRP